MNARSATETVAVTGVARKCRPWWWRKVEGMEGLIELARAARLVERPELQFHFDKQRQPLSGGIVEVYERECCGHNTRIGAIVDRLRELLDVVPIPLPERTGPWGSSSFAPRTWVRLHQDGVTRGSAMPAERLFDDYQAMVRLDDVDALAYVLARPHLRGLICACASRKVGETRVQSGGRIDFSYRRRPRPDRAFPKDGRCPLSFAVRIYQGIDGHWVMVYNGVAAHDWFAEGEEIDARTSHWQASTHPGGMVNRARTAHVVTAARHH